MESCDNINNKHKVVFNILIILTVLNILLSQAPNQGSTTIKCIVQSLYVMKVVHNKMLAYNPTGYKSVSSN